MVVAVGKDFRLITVTRRRQQKKEKATSFGRRPDQKFPPSQPPAFELVVFAPHSTSSWYVHPACLILLFHRGGSGASLQPSSPTGPRFRLASALFWELSSHQREPPASRQTARDRNFTDALEPEHAFLNTKVSSPWAVQGAYCRYHCARTLRLRLARISFEDTDRCLRPRQHYILSAELAESKPTLVVQDQRSNRKCSTSLRRVLTTTRPATKYYPHLPWKSRRTTRIDYVSPPNHGCPSTRMRDAGYSNKCKSRIHSVNTKDASLVTQPTCMMWAMCDHCMSRNLSRCSIWDRRLCRLPRHSLLVHSLEGAHQTLVVQGTFAMGLPSHMLLLHLFCQGPEVTRHRPTRTPASLTTLSMACT